MPSGRHLTTTDVAEMRDMYGMGVARKDLASWFGVHYATVRKYTRPMCRCPRIPGVAAFFWDAGAA